MLFDFQCGSCERVEDDVYLKFHHDETDFPMCCESHMNKVHFRAPTVHWKDYDLPQGGFRIGKENTEITSRKQRREYMKRHELIDSNDLYVPPTKAEENRANAEKAATINAITPTERQATALKKVGLLDAV